MARRNDIGSAKSGQHDPLYDRLASMNMSELEQTARDAGVPHSSEMKKEQLIAAIKQRTK